MNGGRDWALGRAGNGDTMVGKAGYEASRRWWHVARDALEFNRNLPRNSPVSTTVHTFMGFGGGLAVGVGGAQLFPDHDPENPDQWDKLRYMKSTSKAMQLPGWFAVAMTAGHMWSTKGRQAIPRGVNPLYFLAVGGAAQATFVMPKLIENLEE